MELTLLLFKSLDTVLHFLSLYGPCRLLHLSTARLAAKSDTFSCEIVAAFLATIARKALGRGRFVDIAVVGAVRGLICGHGSRATIIKDFGVLLLLLEFDELRISFKRIVFIQLSFTRVACSTQWHVHVRTTNQARHLFVSSEERETGVLLAEFADGGELLDLLTPWD
jgi:hypothetical protein